MNLRPFDPAALMYHELRAPLGLVATAAQSIADGAPDEETRRRCEMIVRATERMLRTAATVAGLDGAVTRNAASFAPGPVLRDLTASLAGLGVALETDISLQPGLLAQGTAERFEALLHSVISNALDHGEPGATIGVRARAREGAVVVDVMNTVAFVDRHQGSGLGALIVSALARGMDARVDSAHDGTAYTTRITLARPEPSTPAAHQPGFPSSQSA